MYLQDYNERERQRVFQRYLKTTKINKRTYYGLHNTWLWPHILSSNGMGLIIKKEK